MRRAVLLMMESSPRAAGRQSRAAFPGGRQPQPLLAVQFLAGREPRVGSGRTASGMRVPYACISRRERRCGCRPTRSRAARRARRARPLCRLPDRRPAPPHRYADYPSRSWPRARRLAASVSRSSSSAGSIGSARCATSASRPLALVKRNLVQRAHRLVEVAADPVQLGVVARDRLASMAGRRARRLTRGAASPSTPVAHIRRRCSGRVAGVGIQRRMLGIVGAELVARAGAAGCRCPAGFLASPVAAMVGPRQVESPPAASRQRSARRSCSANSSVATGPAAHAGAYPTGARLVRCREAERFSSWCRARKPDAGVSGGKAP